MAIPDDKTTLHFVVEKEIKHKLKILADKQDRKLSNYVAQIVENHIKEYEKDLLQKHGSEKFELVFNHIFSDDVEPHQSIQIMINYGIDPDATEDDNNILDSPILHSLMESDPFFNEKMSEYVLEQAKHFFGKRRGAQRSTRPNILTSYSAPITSEDSKVAENSGSYYKITKEHRKDRKDRIIDNENDDDSNGKFDDLEFDYDEFNGVKEEE